MNRLFLLKSSSSSSYNKNSKNVMYTKLEQQILYGRNYKQIYSDKKQYSPLIKELLNVSDRNFPILSIGIYKYFGTDPRILEIELETVIPDSQLQLIDVKHGILGHPKSHYNTMLTIVWDVVYKQNYNENYDPLRLIRKSTLEISKLEDFNKKYLIYC